MELSSLLPKRKISTYFLRAVSALNGCNMRDNAQNHYEIGIAMSMRQWGVTDEIAIAAYEGIEIKKRLINYDETLFCIKLLIRQAVFTYRT